MFLPAKMLFWRKKAKCLPILTFSLFHLNSTDLIQARLEVMHLSNKSICGFQAPDLRECLWKSQAIHRNVHSTSGSWGHTISFLNKLFKWERKDAFEHISPGNSVVGDVHLCSFTVIWKRKILGRRGFFQASFMSPQSFQKEFVFHVIQECKAMSFKNNIIKYK